MVKKTLSQTTKTTAKKVPNTESKTSAKAGATKTKKTTKTATVASAANGWFQPAREASTLNDVKTAVLLVSLTLNVAVFIVWLILRITTVYDAQVYDFLFNR